MYVYNGRILYEKNTLALRAKAQTQSCFEDITPEAICASYSTNINIYVLV